MERNEQTFNEWVQECRKELENIGIHPSDKKVTLNSRLTTTWGRVRYLKKSKEIVKIEISKNHFVYGSELKVKETIIHELIHSCTVGDGHKGMWLIYARKVNRAYPKYNIKRCYEDEEMSDSEKAIHNQRKINSSKKRYVISCKNCNHEYTYKVKSKFVKMIDMGYDERLRCGICNRSMGFTYRVI